MDTEQLKSQVFELADEQLLSGSFPQAEVLAEELTSPLEEISSILSQWRNELPQRVVVTDRDLKMPGMPDTLAQSFVRIWHQAVQEAQSRVSLTRQRTDIGVEVEKRSTDEALQRSQHLHQEMEARYREQTFKLEESYEHVKALDAEITVLKTNLSSETNIRKKEEKARSTLEHELAQLRKAHEDARRTFDQRLKDEQRHMLETLAKEEVDTRYYRNALEKVREEAGKKESELTREIHDLQARMARKDVKNETLKSQLKSQETELLKMRQEGAVLQRDMTKMNSQLLAELNKTKRLETKLKELQEDIRRNNQKNISYTNEAAKRDNLLRAQLMEKEEMLVRAEAKINSLEKRLISGDEEIRRLNSRF
ncbi:DNA-binding protein [Nitrincola iocasae]|jgi:septal ring factor EnvC (AmiA/AmiB activator)|uniref:KfrA N-terminal DNA-binding domain-containing protein n=1 Tax=Nitrincola iocasae TaxID=2614693 RepID=A0A5J6LEE7_9GAMM|nr:DNA-binding protein [Nitrincola iocasae]QEW06970.1 hypothetical protein F5I99_10860 [Nitrincola iocasae]